MDDNHKYLREKVYEKIKTRASGRLFISVYYTRKVAQMLGGDYDALTSTQKRILRSDIVDETIYLEGGIEKYLKY